MKGGGCWGEKCAPLFTQLEICSHTNLTAENTPLLKWSQSTLTKVLLQGDSVYIKALNNRLIDSGPGVELLSINNLPKFVDASCGMGMFSFQLFDTTVSYHKKSSAVHTECQTPHLRSDSNDVVPIVVQENDELHVIVDKNTTLPVMVDGNIELPVMVDKTIELPVMVDKNIELPVMVDKTIELPVMVDKTIELLEKNTQLPIGVEQCTELPIGVEKFTELQNVIVHKTSLFFEWDKALQHLRINVNRF